MRTFTRFEQTIGVIAFIVSGIIYFPATSFWILILFTVITVGLAYFTVYRLRRMKNSSILGNVGSCALLLLSIIVVSILYSSVRVFPNLCSFYLNPPVGRNYFTGEEQKFGCGNMPWYYTQIEGTEARQFELEQCNEYVANDFLRKKYEAEKGIPFDSLTGNFSVTETTPYLAETKENTFGIIGGNRFGFDFSTGNRTLDAARADIVLEEDTVKTTSGAGIYLGKTKDPYGYDFHLNDRVFATEPVISASLEDTHFFFIKTREGNFAKVAISSVSRSNRGDVIVTIRWAYQPNGSTSLRSDYLVFVRELETWCDQYK